MRICYWWGWASASALALLVGTARCEVTVLQNGCQPSEAYSGCCDTWLSDEQYERNRSWNVSETLRVGGKRHALIRFDLGAIPGGNQVHKAWLLLAHTGYPHKQGGKYALEITAYAVARPWAAEARWDSPNPTQGEQSRWKTAGGDIDETADFGLGEPGAVARCTVGHNRLGHVCQWDVTSIVQQWHSGVRANYGLLLKGSPAELASSRWYVPAARPMLLVEHAPKGQSPAQLSLAEPPARVAPSEIELDPISHTPDRGKPQPQYATVLVGQNSSCILRGNSTDAYIKAALERFAGTWGWMDMCRVGGRAGDVNVALLYFDLAEIPKSSSIQQAVLRLYLTAYTNQQVNNYRYGAFLIELPDSPGWDAATVTWAERRAGQPWPGGDRLSWRRTKPVAIGKLLTRQVEHRGEKRTVPAALEFDLTGVVRAWVQGGLRNCGIALDHSLEGGAYDFYSSRAWQPELRPVLQIALWPPVAGKLKPVALRPSLPPGQYWVEPMRQVHKRFRGTPGTLAQYGDSITVTMAFLAPHAYAERIEPKNCPAEVRKQLDLIQSYANRKLWIQWKGGEYGNTGMMMSDWLLRNVDQWQKKLQPEAAVILFGTNDIGRIMPPEYTENMAAALRRMMADGTVPMLTTVPPKSGADQMVHDLYLAALTIARELKVPVIDYYGQILARRPDDWDGRLEKFKGFSDVYEVPTLISADGTHPSNPKKFQNDFSEEALGSNGYNLRNYLTLRMYAELIEKVFLHTAGQ
jgi:lysophospholipase L1-like esterase